MNSSVKKLLVAEVLMILVLLISFFVPVLFTHYKYLIFLCLLGVGVYYFIGIDITKSTDHKTLLKTVLIYIVAYFIFIYILGLFTDFAYTIYNWGIVNFIKNIIPTTTVIIVSEVLRFQFIKKSNKNKLIIFLSFLAFTLLDVCIGYSAYNLANKNQLFQFIGIIILGGISRNILMTIIDIKGDFYIGIIYRLIMELYVFIVPIVPDLGLYLTSVFAIIFPTFISYSLLFGQKKKLEKPGARKKGSILYLTVVFILLILVGLNSGLFKYQSLVIGSNSMVDCFRRGDVVLIDKISDSKKKQLKKGDIIVFEYDNKLIAHRIYEVYNRNDNVYFATKGDNNSQVDAGVVNTDDIVGKVFMTVKKVGLPSIWLSETF